MLACLRLLKDERGLITSPPANQDGVSVPRDADRIPDADVTVFLSHAKQDIPRQKWRGPLHTLVVARTEVRIKEWIDSNQIAEGSRFDESIEKGIERCDCFIVLLTDNYSGREWCQRELLVAKRLDRPIVVVDAVQSNINRLDPNIGNAPVTRWRAAFRETEPTIFRRRSGFEAIEAEDAADVLRTAMSETLRHRHEQVRLQMGNEAGEFLIFATKPEAITMAMATRRTGARRIRYPDPPLGDYQLRQLDSLGFEMTTPLSSLPRCPAEGSRIALLISESQDIVSFGGSSSHLENLLDDLTLYLLWAGYKLGYGGLIGYTSPAKYRDRGYVETLIELAERYKPTSDDQPDSAVVRNWLAWPYRLRVRPEHLNRYTASVELESIPLPSDVMDGLGLHGGLEQLDLKERDEAYAAARALTAMRERATQDSRARISIGGKLVADKRPNWKARSATISVRSGLLPGVVEEVVLSLRSRQPLFLIGGFGGATRAMGDLLQGKPRSEFVSGQGPFGRGWRNLSKIYVAHRQVVATPEDLVAEVKGLGAGGLSHALNNGLDNDDNAELCIATDPRRIVELVLRGLSTSIR